MTQVPDDPEVHWRAVPSLREIWSEERRRMAHLLPPSENFLSDELVSQSSEVGGRDTVQTPTFTLSVKKGADKPGARLALKGVHSLMESSPGLEDDFNRAMADIVTRHNPHLNGIDERMSMNAKNELKKENEKHAVFGYNTPSKSPAPTPTRMSQDEAFLALESLLSQFSNEASPNKSCIHGSPKLSMSHQSTPMNSNVLSQSISQPMCTTQLTQADLREVEDDLEFCRMMDRNDNQVGCSDIDPHTLTPYGDAPGDDFLSEEENMKEEEFEQTLTMLGTQDNGPTKLRVEPSDSESEIDGLHSQCIEEDSTPKHVNCLAENENNSFRGEQDHLYQNAYASESQLSSTQSEVSVARDGYMTSLSTAKLPLSFTSDSSIEQNGNGHGDYMHLKQVPPTRGSFQESYRSNGSKKIQWYPMTHKRNATVPWLRYPYLFKSKANSIDAQTVGVYFEPVRKPPSAARIRRWLHRIRKDEGENEMPSRKEEQKEQRAPISQHAPSMLSTESQESDVLKGIGQQGGRIFVEGGGTLKTSNCSSPSQNTSISTQVTMMSIEVHIQCRTGRAGVKDSREIAMRPDPSRDPVCAVCYVYGYDPGKGENIEVVERVSIFVPTENEISSYQRDYKGEHSKQKLISLIGKTMGCSKELKIETAANERQLLLRLASIVRWKDPDALMSWDTQGLGLGYLIDRGLALGDKDDNSICIDMVRLLGRTPKYEESKKNEDTFNRLFDELDKSTEEMKPTNQSKNWAGSGLGTEWDDRVGAGAGPSSIIGRLILNCRKVISDEVKHPNSSYQPAIVSAVLNKRLPFHDDLILTKWYGGNKGAERWRVLKYRISQALVNIKLFDALDVIGRAGEAARLSGVELSQSFPGIRGSQYKVEGVLLRALQSLMSDERGEKKGKHQAASLSYNSETTASQSQSPWKVRRNTGTLQTMGYGKEEDNNRGYFFYSPSKSDAGAQEALECQAMTLEPQSGFHFDPVVVCDFTALYPSLIIAYNLCYSTCIGKLEYHSTRKEMRQKGKLLQSSL